MKKAKYLVFSIAFLGLTLEVSYAAFSTLLQETRVISSRLRPLARFLSNPSAGRGVEKELASIGKTRNPRGEMDIPVQAPIHVDWDEQVVTGPRFGKGGGSRVVSVERIPGVGLHGILEPDEGKSKKTGRKS
mgnify:CR=1 FL=1